MKSDIILPSYDSEKHNFKIDFPSMMFPATSFETKHRNMHQLFTVASSLALSGAFLALCVMLREISAAREETDTLTVSLTPQIQAQHNYSYTLVCVDGIRSMGLQIIRKGLHRKNLTMA